PDPLLTARAGTAAAEHPRPKHRIRALTSGLRTSTRQRQGVLAILTAQAIMVAIMTMTPVHVVHHGGTIELVGITISMHILGMYLLAPVAGWMVDRFGYHAPMFVGIAILTASLLIGAIYPDYMPAIVASLILLGLGWSFMNVAGSALFATAVEPDLRASAQGGVDAMANLSGAIAAFIAGPLLAVSSFAALCLIALAVLVPVTVSLVRRRR
ncbi:MAG: MFS transporter, partial [Ancrocorticia populi]